MRGIKLNPVLRATGVFGVVAAMVGGITYAALTSSATLTNNTINSATASLLVWDGDSFESTAQGFTVTDLIPGTPTPDMPFYLKNGSSPLNVTLQSSTPVSSSGFDNFADIQVTIKGYAPGCVDSPVNTNLGLLIAGPVAIPCNTLPANSQGDSGNLNTAGNYSISFNIPSAEVSGSSASVGSFNFTLAGTQP